MEKKWDGEEGGGEGAAEEHGVIKTRINWSRVL